MLKSFRANQFIEKFVPLTGLFAPGLVLKQRKGLLTWRIAFVSGSNRRFAAALAFNTLARELLAA